MRSIGVNELYGCARGHVYKTSKARDFADTIAAYGMQARKRQGWKTYKGPVDVLIVYYFQSCLLDADAPTKQVFDALQLTRNEIIRGGRVRCRVGAGIIVNDKQVRDHYVSPRVDKLHPRVCIAVAPAGQLFELKMLDPESAWEAAWEPTASLSAGKDLSKGAA